MMSKSGLGKGPVGKRPFPADGECSSAIDSTNSSKRLLSENPYAILQKEEEIEKKEKLPPFYIKGFSDNFQQDINSLVSRGLKTTIRLCSDGYKLIVSSTPHYKTVEEYLKRKKAEYFTHDIAANKPFKVVLRGLPDMDINELKAALVELKLQLVNIYKIKRHNEKFKYRDQLYLVHLQRGTTSLKDLSQIRAIFNIVVKWDKYKPMHRDVTQCSKCLNFGHGGRNCHITARCASCGGNHVTAECLTPDTKTPCVNCGQDHPSTFKACPKREDFIRFRQEIAARNCPKSKNKQVPLFDMQSFPELTTAQRRPIPVLAPLPLPQQSSQAPTRSSQNLAKQPPGFRSYAQTANQASPNELYTMDQLAILFVELDKRTQACTTKNEQVAVMMSFYFQHGRILAHTA